MYDIFFTPIPSILNLKKSSHQALERLGLYNVRDLLFYKPYSYEFNNIFPDLSKVREGELIQAEVKIIDILRPNSRKGPLKIQVANDTGDIILIFFSKIPPFIFAKLQIGNKCIISGKIQSFDGYKQITHPEFLFKKSLVTEVQPIYSLTYGLINKQLYGYILDIIKSVEVSLKSRTLITSANHTERNYITDCLNDIKILHLIGIKAIRGYIDFEIIGAIERLSSKELFANQVALLQLKSNEQRIVGHTFFVDKDLQLNIVDKLGFELTQSQKIIIAEIENDQQSKHQMMRLLQGDVGSGKTLVALLTMINVIRSGFQSALMAPTDLLATQHYQFFQKALTGSKFNVALLTGKTKAKEKNQIKVALEHGEIDILIGTHALFQDSVNFKKLGYVIIDEQHRFGVQQRRDLINKSSHPDVLVMTATPIPRSLSLTMFGEMNISLLQGKPKNRLPIYTAVTSIARKNEIMQSLRKKMDLGEQIYWICPLVEKNENNISEEFDLNKDYIKSDIITRAEELETCYPGKVAIIHGQMKGLEKDRIMQQFKSKEIEILVATTVIEVGIDVPSATLIIIENAEAFGLAALHQLRGRVGRGNLQSYCILLYDSKRLSEIGRKRLEIMKNSNDGFYISEQDLILRGGGEILGNKQSGEPVFFFADLVRDLEILTKANNLAKEAIFDQFQQFQIKLFAKNDLKSLGSG